MIDAPFIAALAGLLGTLSGIIGGIYSYISRRQMERTIARLRGAEADGTEITNMAEMMAVINELRKQRTADFDEILLLKNEVAALKRETKLLREGRWRDRRVINAALKHIKELRAELEAAGHPVPPMPDILIDWQEEYRDENGKDDS